MNLESIRAHCLSLPHVTESVQWGDNLVFKVGGKMFLLANLEPAEFAMSLKVGREEFFTLQEIEGIEPAPYLARAQWLALREFHTLRDAEMEELIRTAHRIVWEGLPAKRREELAKGVAAPSATGSEKVAPTKQVSGTAKSFVKGPAKKRPAKKSAAKSVKTLATKPARTRGAKTVAKKTPAKKSVKPPKKKQTKARPKK
jgi:predicted DNA-binding protein (MmcQ/YjbR family)